MQCKLHAGLCTFCVSKLRRAESSPGCPREEESNDHHHTQSTPGGVTRDAGDLCPVQCPRLGGIQGTGSVPEILPGMVLGVSRDTEKSRVAEPCASQVAHVPARCGHP